MNELETEKLNEVLEILESQSEDGAVAEVDNYDETTIGITLTYEDEETEDFSIYRKDIQEIIDGNQTAKEVAERIC